MDKEKTIEIRNKAPPAKALPAAERAKKKKQGNVFPASILSPINAAMSSSSSAPQVLTTPANEESFVDHIEENDEEIENVGDEASWDDLNTERKIALPKPLRRLTKKRRASAYMRYPSLALR